MKSEITIYSKSGCPFCDIAKRWFDSKGLKYQEIVLDCMVERQKFYESVGNGVKTVPQIFIKERRIGGYMELVKQESYVNYLIDPSSIGEEDI